MDSQFWIDVLTKGTAAAQAGVDQRRAAQNIRQLDQQYNTGPGMPLMSDPFLFQASLDPVYGQRYQDIIAAQRLQQQQGQQAMERQQQGQTWQQENMTAAQEAAAQLGRDRLESDITYRNQTLAANQAQTLLEQQAAAAEAEAAEQQALLALEGDMAVIEGNLETAQDVVDFVTDKGAFSASNPSQRALAGQQWQLAVRPMVMEMLNTGVLQEGEREEILGLMGDPTAIIQMTDQEQAKIRGLFNKMMQEYKRKARVSGYTVKEIRPGRSVFSQTLGQLAGAGVGYDETTPWTGGGYRPGVNTSGR